jgi:hypothetical protein
LDLPLLFPQNPITRANAIDLPADMPLAAGAAHEGAPPVVAVKT